MTEGIPHAPPMRFEVAGDRVVLPSEHPLARGGRYPPLALLEACAQLAGRSVAAPPGHRGMLVEVQAVRVLARGPVPPGEYRYSVALTRRAEPLWRFAVTIEGVVEAGVTLWVG